MVCAVVCYASIRVSERKQQVKRAAIEEDSEEKKQSEKLLSATNIPPVPQEPAHVASWRQSQALTEPQAELLSRCMASLIASYCPRVQHGGLCTSVAA